jgi:hypothetical protein
MMPDTGLSQVPSVSERVYKALLVAYPKEFRRAYGLHMAQVFKDLCREEQRRGGVFACQILATLQATGGDYFVSAGAILFYDPGSHRERSAGWSRR